LRQKIKKITAILLCCLTLTTVLPMAASAEGFLYNFDEADGGPHCKSLLMVNLETSKVVYAMNPDEQLPMASLTKIMAYIVASENIPDIHNTVITVTEEVKTELEGTGSSLAGVTVGEEFTAYQLLHLMMIPSGNDAALTLEKYVDTLDIKLSSKQPKVTPTSENEETDEDSPENPDPEAANDLSGDKSLSFIDLMNLKAKELGCENTKFTNSHGLHDEDHYTTARDMVKIVEFAMALPDFTKITQTPMYILEPTNTNPQPREIFSTNRMLSAVHEEYYKYSTGIKTGSHNEAGYCIAASAVRDGYSYVVIALGAPRIDENGNTLDFHGEMWDTRELFQWAFQNLKLKTIAENGQLLGSVELKYAWKKDNLQVVASENVSTILPDTVETSSIIPILELPDSIEAPVKKGDVIGKATLTYADEVIGSVSLVAAETVEKSEMLITLEQGKAVFTSHWFLIVIAAIGFLVLLYIVLLIYSRKKKRKLKKVRRYRDM
jgi:D-alanyl-D-alanine carboxypeptidase